MFVFILSSRTWSEAGKANRSCQTTPTAYVVPLFNAKEIILKAINLHTHPERGGGVLTFASFVEYVLRTLAPTQVVPGAGFEIDGCQASKPSNDFFLAMFKELF